MKSLLATISCAAVLGAAVGCGDYSRGRQISTQQNESSEAPNFGSATEIQNAQGVSTNQADNAADVGIGGPMSRAAGNYQSQPVAGQTTDDELAKKIKVALTTGSLGTTGVIAENQLTKIDVSVQDGVVTLRGAVANEEEKQSIEKQVAGMKGVKGVRNELTAGARPIQGGNEPLVPRGPGNQ